MLAEWLRDRCPSARFVTAAVLPGYELSFAKKSKDGSGKATLVVSDQPGAKTYGAIFDISCDDLGALDHIEGRGYKRIEGVEAFSVPERKPVSVTTYIADPKALDQRLQPYDWYLALILKGADRIGVPVDYSRWLAATAASADPVPTRSTRNKALEILARLEE